ncbi:hypothetical protein SLA2020_211730 [Shorea laevis]
MAASKFATMLQRNTNRITLVLIYAMLEWVLIFLLLLNSLFWYLIIKFADYFGLKRPCIWCSRLDHLLDPKKEKNWDRDLVCDAHAAQISRLGFCSNHRKLAESEDMCEDCSSSSSECSKNFAYFPWMKQIGLVRDGDGDLKCSCCGEISERKSHSPYLLIKPSWGLLDYTQKENLIDEAGTDIIEEGTDIIEEGEGDHSEPRRSDFMGDDVKAEQGSEENRGIQKVYEEERDDQRRELDADEEFSDFISSFDCTHKPSSVLLDYTQKESLIEEEGTDIIEKEEEEGEVDDSEPRRSDFLGDDIEAEHGTEENRGIQIVSYEKRDDQRRELEVDEDFTFYISSFDCKAKAVDFDEGFRMNKVEESMQGDDLHVSMYGPSSHQEVSNDASSGCQLKHLEFYIDQDDCHLIPIELMDSVTVENQGEYKLREEEQGISGNGDVILDFEFSPAKPVELVVENRDDSRVEFALLSAPQGKEEASFPVVVESAELDEKESFSVHEGKDDLVRSDSRVEFASLSSPLGKHEASLAVVESTELDEIERFSVHEGKHDLVEVEHEEVAMTQATLTLPTNADDVRQSAEIEREMYSDVKHVSDEQNDEIEAEISIGTDIPDHEPIDDVPIEEVLSSQSIEEDPSTGSAQFHIDDNHGFKNDEEEIIQFEMITAERSNQTENNHSLLSSEFNEIEEDKVPDTPTSIDSFHHLHKKLLLLEKKESGTEESWDGSIISDVDGSDGVLTNEKLRSALRDERNALHALYAELEEERSASAVGANQTMAMINRLQEEKAAMQMEALHYQRMMEEQAAYDQEALQLLNELMVKREKEKAELEKELEIYRKKVQDYEAKEKIMMLRRRRDDSTRSAATSASCSNAEDSDGLSVDLNQEQKEEDSFDDPQEGSNQNTPEDAVLYLEESLADFEEERVSILEQLKVLEEKLVTLNDEEEQEFEDMKQVQHLHKENGNGYPENSDFTCEVNGVANGLINGNGNRKHHQEMKFIGPKAKSLLPLFDAETEDGAWNGHENGFDPVSLQHLSAADFELENKKFAIEKEVDHVYNRLQALEADREFLKHCISSLRKGDKGLHLLQEILQHLRDLRSVESQVRTMGDATI